MKFIITIVHSLEVLHLASMKYHFYYGDALEEGMAITFYSLEVRGGQWWTNGE